MVCVCLCVCALFYRTVCITGVLLRGWRITLITHFTLHHVSHYTAPTSCFLTHVKNIPAILISRIIFLHFQHTDGHRSAARSWCSRCVRTIPYRVNTPSNWDVVMFYLHFSCVRWEISLSTGHSTPQEETVSVWDRTLSLFFFLSFPLFSTHY